MSHYWGYHCKTCPDPSPEQEADEYAVTNRSHTWANHGEDSLRALALCAPELKALVDKVSGSACVGWLEFKWLGAYELPEPPEWIIEHAGHDIELMDEYGYTEPL